MPTGVSHPVLVVGASTRRGSGDGGAVSRVNLWVIFFQMSSAGLFWTPSSPSISRGLEKQMNAEHAGSSPLQLSEGTVSSQ